MFNVNLKKVFNSDKIVIEECELEPSNLIDHIPNLDMQTKLQAMTGQCACQVFRGYRQANQRCSPLQFEEQGRFPQQY